MSKVKVIFNGRHAMIDEKFMKTVKKSEDLVTLSKSLNESWKKSTGIEKQLLLIDIQNVKTKMSKMAREITPHLMYLD